MLARVKRIVYGPPASLPEGRTMSSRSTESSGGSFATGPDGKTRLVQGVFSSVAGRYDLMNDLMSGGLHRLWKASFIDSLAPRPGMHLLDVAGGTGDIALRFMDTVRGQGRATVLDANPAMLAEGERRAARRGDADRIGWSCAAAEALPLGDRAADAYSIAFGIRNVTDIDASLREAWRVLRFGSRFLCLEFCPQLAVGTLDRLYGRYSREVIPRLGRWVAGDADAYVYLIESIRAFPDPESFAGRIRAAGFARVDYRLLSGGICAIHHGWKL